MRHQHQHHEQARADGGHQPSAGQLDGAFVLGMECHFGNHQLRNETPPKPALLNGACHTHVILQTATIPCNGPGQKSGEGWPIGNSCPA